MRILLKVYMTYVGFFEEAGVLDDFYRLLHRVETLQDDGDFIIRLLKIGELYADIERFCHRHRKRIPMTVLNRLKADLADIIELIPLPPP